MPPEPRPTSQNLESLIHRALDEVGLRADRIAWPESERADWHVRIHCGSRRFEIGSDRREGFFCREITEGRHRNFVYGDGGPIFHPAEQMCREGLRKIKYALDHPEFEGATYPVI